MLKETIIFLFALVGCHADTLAAPASGVICGPIPFKIYRCLGTQRFLKDEIKCISGSQCDKFKCSFTELGWLADNKVNKTKISEYFDQFALDYPDWSVGVSHLKDACLGPHDLPAQGVYLNCAPYDIMHCVLTSFIRNASSGWDSRPECKQWTTFATSCPICPEDCFSRPVPSGTCNACTSLPKSAN